MALALVLLAAFVPAWLMSKLLSYIGIGWIVEALIATAFIAQSSMRDHVRAVHRALGSSLVEARRAVAKIVGRDTATLDESAIARAALESLAENTSDGVVAPAFWYALLGLPGLVVYKAINTADSMIGHKSERYIDFGWAAAKLDDLVNECREGKVDRIIIALPQSAPERLAAIVEKFDSLPVSTHIVTHITSDLLETDIAYNVSNLGPVGLLDVKKKRS